MESCRSNEFNEKGHGFENSQVEKWRYRYGRIEYAERNLSYLLNSDLKISADKIAYRLQAE